jgi:hypothetical protein
MWSGSAAAKGWTLRLGKSPTQRVRSVTQKLVRLHTDAADYQLLTRQARDGALRKMARKWRWVGRQLSRLGPRIAEADAAVVATFNRELSQHTTRPLLPSLVVIPYKHEFRTLKRYRDAFNSAMTAAAMATSRISEFPRMNINGVMQTQVVHPPARGSHGRR